MTIPWFGLLGPSDDGLGRTTVLVSWTCRTQESKLDGADSMALSSLERVPFGKDQEVKVVQLNERFVAGGLRRKGATVTLAAIGTDELELDVFLERLETNCLQVLGLDSAKSVSVSSIKSNNSALSQMAEEMVMHSRIRHLDADGAVKLKKQLVAGGTSRASSFKN